MPSFRVINKTAEPVWCQISNEGGNNNAEGYYPLAANGGTDNWPRDKWECIRFKDEHDVRKKQLWANRGNPSVIHWNGFDKDLTVINSYAPSNGHITLHNETGKTIWACVSRNQGMHEWRKILDGDRETWERQCMEYETVAVRNEEDTKRKGMYVHTGLYRAVVTFRGFEEKMLVEVGTSNTAIDEHYDEAVACANRSHFCQETRAPFPGGLKPSIEKCELLELLSVGKTMNLDDPNQIFTLALLISHLKFGFVQPAVVVEVTGEWVKVAAYNNQFDAIVVLGFPKEAVKQVAPFKQVPAVGTRMVHISQFTAKTGMLEGVIGDITCGNSDGGSWYNFHPLVAQFVTDDSLAPIWQEHIDRIPKFYGDNIWENIWAMWLEWKEDHGPDFFRLGTPTRIKEVATLHVEGDAPPPAYAA